MYERILLPTDGSDGADRATEHAVALARATGAALDVLHVTDEGGVALDAHSEALLEAAEQRGRAAVEATVERASRAGVDTVTGQVTRGRPHRAILDYADERGADVVVMGTHGRRGLQRALLGSVTERVVRLADVPVLAVPPVGKRDGD